MSYDLNKVILWNNFKERVLRALDEQDAFEVDLAFEFKDASGKINTYTSGEKLFITDVKLSNNCELAFEMANGAKPKFIGYNYADSLSNSSLGTLDECIERIYTETYEAFEGNEDYPDTIQNFVASIRSSEVTAFNNSAEWIKKTMDAERDKQSFNNIEDFGMF